MNEQRDLEGAEFSPAGIRVNAVAPGPVFTAATTHERIEAQGATTLLSRAGRPGEIAEVITGAVIAADGGRTAILSRLRADRPHQDQAQATFLSDAGRHVQKGLDIREYTDPFHDPMIPYTLVLKPGLVIHSVYNGYWFWGRPSFEDLRRDLRDVVREIRPDWDLAAPGFRESWDSGDKSAFYPYQADGA